MSTLPSNKIELNINWCRVATVAGISAGTCFLLGLLMRARLLLFMADFIILGTFVFSLAVLAVSVIKSKSKQNSA